MADQIPPVIEEPRGSFFSNLVAIIGLIILIVVVIWGLVHLMGLSQSWLSGLFNRTPKITITAPTQVTSGEKFDISWQYSTEERGNYAFLYQCKSGLTLKSADIAIPCGNSYTVGTATTLSFTPVLEGVATTSMPISVVFLPNATSSQRVQGSATILVNRVSSATPTPAPSGTPTPPPAGGSNPPSPTPSPTPTPASANTSPADLSVRILALGVIDRSTGMFVQRAPMYYDDIAAAQFDIANIGGSSSGTYYFSANLPTAGGYVYNSPAQNSLQPGDHMINTLRWSNSAQTGTFTVALSGDSVPVNNYASATLVGGYAPQPTYQAYPPQYQQYPQQYNNYYTNPMYYQPYTY
jgi:cell division septation protein DedD